MNEQSPDERRINLVKRTLNIAFFRAIFLAIVTLAVGLLTSSLSIITESVHIGVDIITSLIALISIRKAMEPPDETHQYGHGKFASLGGVIEGLLITVVSIFIIIMAIMRIVKGVTPIEHTWLGLLIIAVGAVINSITYVQIRRANLEVKMTALSGEALHLLGDVFIAISILVGLSIAYFTGFWLVDALLAIGISIFMVVNAIRIARKGMGWLLDESIDEEDMEKLREIFERREGPVIDYHDLMTTMNGPFLELDVHLDVCARESLTVVHDSMERYEVEIKRYFWNALVMIHPEPCGQYPDDCDSDECPLM